MEHPTGVREAFARISMKGTQYAGSPWAFSVAILVVLVWAISGPLFHFSDTWQLFINTGTTVVTFLMVFLIQHAQNRDTRALHLKLDELIAAVEGASNHLIDIEEMDEDDLERLQARFRELAQRAGTGADASKRESVENVRDAVGEEIMRTKREHAQAKRSTR